MASSPIVGKIDIHNHFVPPSYAQGGSSTKNGTQHLDLEADTKTAVADAVEILQAGKLQHGLLIRQRN